MDIRWIFMLLFVGNLDKTQGTRLKKWLGDHDSGNTDQAPGTKSDTPGLSLGDNTGDSFQCIPTQQKFVQMGVGEASVTINTQTHDSDMLVCYNGKRDIHRQSCCTRTMERLYQVTAIQDYHHVLQASSSYLRNLMTDNAVHYQELFLQLLGGAHNKTERLFSEVYHLPLMDRWGPTESLFLDLQAYLRQKDVSIHKSIETFFDELFPLVFHNNINDPRTSEISEDYRECLMEVRRNLYPPPFGGIPGKLAHQLARSFASARAFLDTLKMGIKVINVTTHMPLTDSCQHALTRLEYCGHCESHVNVFPCRGFCYNVMRGCFAHITDINIHWNEMIDALELLTVNMRGSNDIEEVLHSFHSKVSEAIMHAMETAVKFNHKVVQRCGQPKSIIAVPDGANPVHDKPDASVIIPTLTDGTTPLYAKIEMFMRNVIAAKGHLSHLPDTMCTEERFSAGLEGPCWNGENVEAYNKSIMTKDLAAQKKNPEVQVNDKADPTIQELTKQIITMKKLLSSKVNLDRMQRDAPHQAQADDPAVSYYNYGRNNDDRTKDSDVDTWSYSSGDPWYNKGGGQGSYYDGYYGNPPQDDEDWGGYSGVGSGSGYYGSVNTPYRTSSRRPGAGNTPHNEEFTFEDTKKTPYITQTPKPAVGDAQLGGVSPITSSSVVLCLSIICVWLGSRV